MILDKLERAGVISPPKFLVANTMYLTIMGSMAYQVSTDNSDMDLYGFCIPSKEFVFPYSTRLVGFDSQVAKFDEYQQHHIRSPDSEQTYDITVYSIVRYFRLLMDMNPNLCDSIFTPRNCVLHSTPIGEMVRENRRMFLHKGVLSKMRGYAFAQFSKIKTKSNSKNPKRMADIEANGLDTKFLYHTVRLLLECQQILTTHDLDLGKDRETLKAIRRGEWTLEFAQEWFDKKQHELETIAAQSTLRNVPDEEAIKNLLLRCLEAHYGSLDKYIRRETSVEKLLTELQSVLDRYK